MKWTKRWYEAQYPVKTQQAPSTQLTRTWPSLWKVGFSWTWPSCVLEAALWAQGKEQSFVPFQEQSCRKLADEFPSHLSWSHFLQRASPISSRKLHFGSGMLNISPLAFSCLSAWTVLCVIATALPWGVTCRRNRVVIKGSYSNCSEVRGSSSRSSQISPRVMLSSCILGGRSLPR